MQEIQRIEAMESILENQIVILFELNQLLDQVEATHQNLVKLSNYYGSEEFHHDVEMHQNDQLSEDLKRMVLSEDGIYNVITDYFQTANRMIEIATTKLKDY